MKTSIIKKQILSLLLVVAAFQVNSQVVPDSVYHERLFYLCKVWGHAKYYHTRIAAGLVNWDNELLNTVTAAKTATTNAAFNEVLLNMLNNAGTMGTSNVTLPVVPDSLNNNNDLGWILSPFLSDAVRANLNLITSRFRPQSNVYVTDAATGSNPAFDNDSLYYTGEDFPGEEKRMLTMFRYWNQVHYFFPYKKIMDQNWDTTLVEFIPKIAASTDALTFNLAFSEFRTRINDGHAGYYSPVYNNFRGLAYPPFLVRYIENEMVITKVLQGVTNVAVGDVIKEIDGVNIYTLRDSLRKHAHGSNHDGIERNLNVLIMFGDSGEFEITVENSSGTHTTTLTRNLENANNLVINNTPVWRETTVNDICTFGIVDMGRLETTQVANMFADLWNTDAIIFDIRNYPKGTLWYIVNYLFSSPIHIAKFTVPDINYPGRLTWLPVTIGSGTSNPYRGKIILLFDERTISQSEYTCMGLEQFPGAIKIGSQTAGADGNVSISYLTSNISTYFTGLGTYYPDYTPTQRIGIVPDFEVRPTIAGIRAGQDEVLDYALDCNLIGINYCASRGNNTSGEWINKVSLGTFSKTSGANGGYGDFRSPAIEVESGLTYNLALTPGFKNKTRAEYWRVWIDYNQDGDFTDAGEQVFAANGTKTAVSGTITIPAGITGETGMRVSMKYNAAPTACEQFTYGEVEDYTLSISPYVPMPPVVSFSGNPTEILVGESVQFTDQSINNPVSWLWTFQGGTPATSTLQNPVVTYNSSGTYDVSLQATNAAGSTTLSRPDYITVTEATGVTYCASQGNSNASEWIGMVNISTFVNQSGASFYSDFTNMVIQLLPGSSNTVTLTPGYSGGSQFEYWKIWIDFNADGDFLDAGENVFSANKKKSVVTGTISIPGSASGQTRMRISMKNGSAPSPCEVFAKGEVEDYTVSFSGGTKSMEVNPEFEVLVYANPSNDAFSFLFRSNSNELAIVQVFDFFGKLVETYSSISSDETIAVGRNLKPGMYLAIVTQGNDRKMIKLSKVR
ncbi:MAG: GEVED domain-containing protein [Lentimicrobium sp.]